MLIVFAPLLSLSLAAPTACAADTLERASDAVVVDARGRTQVVLGADVRFTLGAAKRSDAHADAWGGGFVQWAPAPAGPLPRLALGPVPNLGASVFALHPGPQVAAGIVAQRGEVAQIQFAAPLTGPVVVLDACGRWVGVATAHRGGLNPLEPADALVDALLHPAAGFRVAPEVHFAVDGAGQVVVRDAPAQSPLKKGDRVIDIALLPARDAIAAARALRAQPADKKMLIKVRRGDADAVVFLAPRE